MGLLDDAIREHLELKRRRGADAGEVSREESEALGPVRRAPDGSPDLASIPAPPTAEPPGEHPDWADETVALTPPPIPAQPPPPSLPQPSASGYATAPALPDPAFDDDEPLPPLDEPAAPAAPREKTRRLPGAGRLRLRRGRNDPEPEPQDDPATAAPEPPPPAYEPPPPAAYEPPPPTSYEPQPPTADPAGEDLLEETPEFLEETPDHDRLWFEQRPPRDFDFDK
jgi:hypothetical protein